MRTMLGRPLGLAMRLAFHAKSLVQRITGARPFPVHAVALTGAGEVVLVGQTYFPGWQLPAIHISSRSSATLIVRFGGSGSNSPEDGGQSPGL